MIKIININSYLDAYNLLIKRIKESDNVNIVVNTGMKSGLQKFLFENADIVSSFNLKIYEINNFIESLSGISDENILSHIEAELMIYSILLDKFGDLKVLNSNSLSLDYANSIIKVLLNFKEYKISQSIGLIDSSNSQFKFKMQDLDVILTNYEKFKGEKKDFVDMLGIAQKSNLAFNNKYIFLGFDELSYTFIDFIISLSKDNEVDIFCQHGSINNDYIFDTISKNSLIQKLKSINVSFSEIDCEKGDYLLQNYLADNLFGVQPNNFVLKDNIVAIFQGNSVIKEIEFVARTIKQQILMGNRYKEFGVAIFEKDKYIQHIKEIFSKYELNAQYNENFLISNSILYKFFKDLFKYNFEKFNTSHIIDLISSPYFDEADCVKSGLILKVKSLNITGIIDENLSSKLGNENFYNFINQLTLDKDLDKSSIIEKLNQIIKNLDMFNKTIELSKNYLGIEKQVLISSVDCVNDVLDILSKINIKLNLIEFFNLFVQLLDEQQLVNKIEFIDAIDVIDANNITKNYENLFIINCSHDNSPSVKYDGGIILDSDVREINYNIKCCDYGKAFPVEINRTNRLLKQKMVNNFLMFSKNLFFTFSQTKGEIIDELTSRIALETEIGVVNIEVLHLQTEPIYEALSWRDELDYKCENCKKNLENDCFGVKNNEISCINKQNAKIFTDLQTITPSKLENYFKCPFMSYLSDFLKIKPQLDDELESFDIGNMLHEILFKYYKLDKNVTNKKKFCANIIKSYIEKNNRLSNNQNSSILDNLVAEAERILSGVDEIDNCSSFKPNKNFLEHAFENKNALKLKNIDIVGKVDRVDFFNDMARLIDYKSGKADANLKELYYGNKLQLFLYACAIEQETKKKVVGSFYLPLHNKFEKDDGATYSLKGFYLNDEEVIDAMDNTLEIGEKSKVFNAKKSKSGKASRITHKELEDSELLALKNYSKFVSSKAVEDMCSGYIKPSPSAVSSPCEFCPYSHICMRNSNDIKERETGLVTLESFKGVDNG